jgi:hypothetical protein
MFHYYSVTLTAEEQGSTAVTVRCESCYSEYYYRLDCAAYGSAQAPYGLGAAFAKKRARKEAKRRLERMLQTETLAVPCPQCGWFQQSMVSQLRAPLLPWSHFLGLCSTFGGAVLILLATVITLAHLDIPQVINLLAVQLAWLVAPLPLLAGIAALIRRRQKNAAYDPNDLESEQARIELGRKLSITKEQAEAIMQDQ